jgi:two-component system CheB/CheR fusion protein
MTIATQATSQNAAIEMPGPSSSPSVALPTVLVPVTRPECDEATRSTIFIVDDDKDIREILTDILEDGGYTVQSFASGALLLQGFHPCDADCLLVDAQLTGLSGVEIISWMKDIDATLPSILVSGTATLKVSVQAMKAGAVDFVQKPFKSKTLYESIETAISNARRRQRHAVQPAARMSADFHLTKRQHEILDLVLDGQPSKIIAADLGISQRTVENHRAAIMKKTGSRSIPALVRATLKTEERRVGLY